MKNDKITQSLLFASVLAVILNIARLDMWGTTSLLYLIWNLFLAWIPYFISSNYIKKDTPIGTFVPFFVIWILFFPNAPYLVTDVLHIASGASLLLWYDSLIFFFFGWIGLLLGMLSLYHIHQYFKIHFGHTISEAIVFFICFISSFGIYLGRFERWNSWDMFINPIELMRHSYYISTSFRHSFAPFMFMLVFTAFIYSVYKTIYFLISKE